MKIPLLLIIAILFSSCKTIDVSQSYKNNTTCFTKEDYKKVIQDKDFGDGDGLKIHPIITNEENCIGLYRYYEHNLQSVSIIHKILKFENEIYLSKSNTLLDNQKLALFKNSYSKYFTQDEMNLISENFLKGNELQGLFY
ncbi:hypothetical protein [Aureivirga sp. CE67]|uniref:hypothetical protein n=1 Tax=Aureivirga sp. CE67 TaxID=1788983 RepID=UPI0018CA3CCA|nr:hypothetical protein [Aureivirga sp. CE67]